MFKGSGAGAPCSLKAAVTVIVVGEGERSELSLLKFPILPGSWLILARANGRETQLPYNTALCTFQF
jgi:hypothetical protein